MPRIRGAIPDSVILYRSGNSARAKREIPKTPSEKLTPPVDRESYFLVTVFLAAFFTDFFAAGLDVSP